MTDKTDLVAASMFEALTVELTAIADKAGTGPVADEARGLIVKLKANGFKHLATASDALKLCEDNKFGLAYDRQVKLKTREMAKTKD